MGTLEELQLSAFISALRSEPAAAPLLFEQFLNLLEDTRPELAQLAATSAQVGARVGQMSGGTEWVREVSNLLVPDPDLVAKQLLEDRRGNSHESLAVDVLVLTVKQVEFNAAWDALGIARQDAPRRQVLETEVWTSEIGGVTFALGSVGMDGNVESALKLASLLRGLHCRAAFLVGTAAGVKGKVQLGDVVVGEEIWAADFEILRPSKITARPRTYAPATFMFARLATFDGKAPGWAASIKQEIAELFARGDDTGTSRLPRNYHQMKRTPSTTLGVIFAGSRLIEDGSLVQRRTDEHGRLVAAEMEGAGFAAAIKEHKQAHWLVVRGVSDFGDEGRAKDWQYVSSYAAAALVRDAVLNGTFPMEASAPPARSRGG